MDLVSFLGCAPGFFKVSQQNPRKVYVTLSTALDADELELVYILLERRVFKLFWIQFCHAMASTCSITI